MNEEHFMVVSLDDSKSKVIADILGNKTCKKIVLHLSEISEASEKDLADYLNLPINTVEYNLKKLLESGFVQKKKNFFWSKRGKKIPMYELTNKSIVISPKKSLSEKMKSVLPAFILTITGTFLIWMFEKISFSHQTTLTRSLGDTAGLFAAKSSPEISQVTTNLVVSSPHFLWLYFLTGAVLALLVVWVINWRKL